MPTFKIEVLRLVSNVQLVKPLPYNEWQIQHYSSLAVTHDALRYSSVILTASVTEEQKDLFEWLFRFHFT